MKSLIFTGFLLAFAIAEPQLSNSYLPPPPSAVSSGYPQGGPGIGSAPEIVAARNFGGFGQAATGNGFPRNGFHSGASAHGRFSPNSADQGFDHNTAAFVKNSLEDGISDPVNYNFGYSVNDYQEGTDFGHQETRHEGSAHGEYHVTLPDGRKQTVSYEADDRGYKSHVSYEDTEATIRAAGYDANANNGGGYRGNGNHGNAGNGARTGKGRKNY